MITSLLSQGPLGYCVILVVSILSSRILTASNIKTKFIVGVLIEGNNFDIELAVNASLKKANEGVIKSSQQIWNSEFVPAIERITSGDAFQASQMACKLIKKGIVAMLGPKDPVSASHVRAICSRYGIPYFETAWGFRQDGYNESINLHPYYKTFGQAIKSFITQAERWDKLAIIYYSEESLLKFEDLLNGFEKPVMLRQWRKTDGSYKYLMKYLLSSSQLRFIVDIPYWLVQEFLDMATTYNMTTSYYSYVFTDLDVFLVDLSSYKLTQAANMTTVAIAPIEPFSKNNILLEGLRESVYQSKLGLQDTEIRPLLTTGAALVFDAVQLLAHGIIEMSKYQLIHPSSLECGAAKSWVMGTSIISTTRSLPPKRTQPLTGDLYFDSFGWRNNFNLTILEVSVDGYHRFAYWNAKDQMVITKHYSKTNEESSLQLSNMTLRVTTVSESPFVIPLRRDENGIPLPDPEYWDGFCVALLKEIAKECKFNFTLYLVEDNAYGSPNGTKPDGTPKFNGMIGDLMDHKADLALAPLTITYERERVIDFTTPFMSLGLSIIYRRPLGKKPDLFSFLQPLSPPVWGYVLAAYILVSFVLFVVARFSPYEWYNPHPCNADSDIVENQFNMLNSLWFTIGSLMQQGTEITPRATSTRIVAGIWWFFTLIIISSYTANLAAFLTTERMKSPIENADDLSKQTKIQYGALRSGSTYSFFKKSKINTYEKMWNYMKSHQSVFAANTTAGIQKVLTEDYAFVLESTMNEFYRQRNCSLMQVGGLLDSKGYGIGLPEGSRYRDIITKAILNLQKKQRIEELRRYWWRQYNITKKCVQTDETSKDANAMEVEQVGGVFVMLLFGVVLSFLVAIIESIYKSSKISAAEKRPLCEKVSEDLHFAVKCRYSKKPTQLGKLNTNDDSMEEEFNFNQDKWSAVTEGVEAECGVDGATRYRPGHEVGRGVSGVGSYPGPPPILPPSQTGQQPTDEPPPWQRSYSDRNTDDRYPELRMKKVPC